MAAAEARAAWQRVANRYIVQEDAKRSPKLARCPSPSKGQYDYGNGEGDGSLDNSSSDSMPFNWNSMNPNLPSDLKLWVQLQPNFGYQKDLIYEQLNKVESELEDKSWEDIGPYSKHSASELDKHPRSFGNSPHVVSTTFMKNDNETKIEELKSGKSDIQNPLKCKEDLTNCWFEGNELMDWKTVDQLISSVPNKDSFDTEHIGSGKKTEPWWHVNDKEELAFLVAQKSQGRFENCDLPPPQNVRVRKDPLACLGRSDDCKKLSSSFESNLHAHIYSEVSHPQRFATLESVNGKHSIYDETSYSFSDSEKMYRSTPSDDAKSKPSRDKSHPTGRNTQLLEALCHSQTRAREAEIAAQKAYDEKEHILKLFLKQASHLFAYKQWLRLLQLESLCLQLKIKEQQLSTLLPTMSWMLEKDDDDKGAKKKGKKQKNCSLCRYIVAFAVGMSIASAGLLLGWTLGWLLPTI